MSRKIEWLIAAASAVTFWFLTAETALGVAPPSDPPPAVDGSGTTVPEPTGGLMMLGTAAILLWGRRPRVGRDGKLRFPDGRLVGADGKPVGALR